MKIQYALMSCNSNPRYASYWPAVAAAWLKLNITPVLLFIPNNPRHQLPEAPGGIVHTIPPLKDVPIIIQALMLPFWGSYLHPNATIITTDINLFPLSNRFFHTQLTTYPDHAYLHLQPKMCRYVHHSPSQDPLVLDLILGTALLSTLKVHNIPEQTTTINKLPILGSCWHIAKGEIIHKVLELAPDWETTCRKTLPYYPHKDTKITSSQFAWQSRPESGYWGGDEIYTSIRLHHSNHQPICYVSYPFNRMQNRQDKYVGFHTASLPYASYQELITHLLEHKRLPRPKTFLQRWIHFYLRFVLLMDATKGIRMAGPCIAIALNGLITIGLRILPLPKSHKEKLLITHWYLRDNALEQCPRLMWLYAKWTAFIRAKRKR